MMRPCSASATLTTRTPLSMRCTGCACGHRVECPHASAAPPKRVAAALRRALGTSEPPALWVVACQPRSARGEPPAPAAAKARACMHWQTRQIGGGRHATNQAVLPLHGLLAAAGHMGGEYVSDRVPRHARRHYCLLAVQSRSFWTWFTCASGTCLVYFVPACSNALQNRARISYLLLACSFFMLIRYLFFGGWRQRCTAEAPAPTNCVDITSSSSATTIIYCDLLLNYGFSIVCWRMSQCNHCRIPADEVYRIILHLRQPAASRDL